MAAESPELRFEHRSDSSLTKCLICIALSDLETKLFQQLIFYVKWEKFRNEDMTCRKHVEAKQIFI